MNISDIVKVQIHSNFSTPGRLKKIIDNDGLPVSYMVHVFASGMDLVFYPENVLEPTNEELVLWKLQYS